MELSDVIKARRNVDRARAFGQPLLHSAYPQASVVGYSLNAVNDVDKSIEVNHVVGPLGSPNMLWFSTRTSIATELPDEQLLSHAISVVMNKLMPEVGVEAVLAQRGLLVAELQSLDHRVHSIVIDEHPTRAFGFEYEGVTFLCVELRSAVVTTVAAPEHIIDAGFVTRFPTE
ncbi:hypothetical protein [Microbacterium sp. NC79]|uniref:hypothetical protein n=1 Tax=Microbacterium sp. NC79 TaxID=2851009 RepID=UPI001C2B8CA1|nr:hypothetical protein [Microbacterium sp. NC79]MBV0895841.1 hypothetical protein [Microbacterium sp. NC79]